MRVIRGKELSASDDFFQILATTGRAQVAVMNLAPGEVSGDYGTDHPQADQILIILEGGGSVDVEGEETTLDRGDVVVIPAGAKHQVRGPSKSLSVYAPIAYPEG